MKLIFLYQKESLPLPFGKRDIWMSVVSICISKHMLSSRIPQLHKYLLHISIVLASMLTLLTSAPALHSLQLTGFPPHTYSFSLYPCYSCWVPRASLSGFLLLHYDFFISSAIFHSFTDSAGHVQATGHVQSTFSLCAGLFRMPLAVFSLISTIKMFP